MKKYFLSVFVAVFILLLGIPYVADAAKLEGFSGTMMDDSQVSESLLAGKKLTMLNFWATWCPPCVAEMPDLGKLGSSMPEGTQLVGVLVEDPSADTKAAAKKILDNSKAGFTQIFPTGGLAAYANTLQFVPTTIFVDSEGNIVGEMITGALSEAGYREKIEAALKLLP